MKTNIKINIINMNGKVINKKISSDLKFQEAYKNAIGKIITALTKYLNKYRINAEVIPEIEF